MILLLTSNKVLINISWDSNKDSTRDSSRDSCRYSSRNFFADFSLDCFKNFFRHFPGIHSAISTRSQPGFFRNFSIGLSRVFLRYFSILEKNMRYLSILQSYFPAFLPTFPWGFRPIFFSTVFLSLFPRYYQGFS